MIFMLITTQDFHHPCHGFFIIVVATICSLWACLRQPCSCCRRPLQGTLEGRSRWKCGGKLTNWQFLERNNIMPEQSARQKISRTFCFKEKSSNTYWSEELLSTKSKLGAFWENAKKWHKKWPKMTKNSPESVNRLKMASFSLFPFRAIGEKSEEKIKWKTGHFEAMYTFKGI